MLVLPLVGKKSIVVYYSFMIIYAYIIPLSLIPPWYSGLAVKHMIDTGAGVVDADYRGPVGVVLFNFGTTDFTIDIGDRIAQLILEKVSMAPVVQVEELSDTARGSGGFGSTGVKSRSAAAAAANDDDADYLEVDGLDKKVQRLISPTFNNVTIPHGEP